MSLSSPGRTPAARLGRIGVWSGELRFAGAEAGVAAARELEAMGWPTAWIPGGLDDKVLDDVDGLLSATERLTIATGILNIWKYEPAEVGAWWRGQTPERQARVMIGVGVSHAPAIGEAYQRPVETMRNYVSRLLDEGVPRESLCVAALGPKMLELSAELTAGAHPYLVSPEHTAIARKTLGPDALLAPEQGVVLETDPVRARELARQALAIYLKLPNYVNSWRRLGFSEDDVTAPSDRLVDALFAWGDAEAIRQRVQAHFDAGADHVCLQVVSGPMRANLEPALAVWRALAPVLL
jgi:probable F420-dependent oxidoreductase